jgi:hypothetical protein
MDLLLFQFIAPMVIQFLSPKETFQAVIAWWFRTIAKKLRITHFLLGERRTEEEIDQDTKKQFLQVPKTDHIEVIPGQKMLIDIGENEDIKGRPNETPEEVELHWTKVYVPPKFKIRVTYLSFNVLS